MVGARPGRITISESCCRVLQRRLHIPRVGAHRRYPREHTLYFLFLSPRAKTPGLRAEGRVFTTSAVLNISTTPWCEVGIAGRVVQQQRLLSSPFRPANESSASNWIQLLAADVLYCAALTSLPGVRKKAWRPRRSTASTFRFIFTIWLHTGLLCSRQPAVARLICENKTSETKNKNGGIVAFRGERSTHMHEPRSPPVRNFKFSKFKSGPLIGQGIFQRPPQILFSEYSQGPGMLEGLRTSGEKHGQSGRPRSTRAVENATLCQFMLS